MTGWMDDALCAQTGPELFFPEDTPDASIRNAKKICSQCWVVEDCLEFAIANGFNHGVFGGLSPKQRRKLVRERAA